MLCKPWRPFKVPALRFTCCQVTARRLLPGSLRGSALLNFRGNVRRRTSWISCEKRRGGVVRWPLWGMASNDGPVLAGAHVSFAFGQAVPLAQGQSDFVVLGDQLMVIATTVGLARKTLRVVRQNLAWAAIYNALCVPLAVAGWMPKPWPAGLGMAASSLLVVLNALRLSKQYFKGENVVDILYLLIPLSVTLVFFILAGLWWWIYRGQLRTLKRKGSEFLRIHKNFKIKLTFVKKNRGFP